MAAINVDSGDKLKGKRIPDLSQGEKVYVDEEDAEKAVKVMYKGGMKLIIAGAVCCSVSLLFIVAFIIDADFRDTVFENGFTLYSAGIILIFILMALAFIIPGVIFAKRGIHYAHAVKNGDRQFYRFEITGKDYEVSHGEDGTSTTYYLYFGNMRCSVSKKEYDKAETRMRTYCAVISYDGEDYFSYCGIDFCGGKYNLR